MTSFHLPQWVQSRTAQYTLQFSMFCIGVIIGALLSSNSSQSLQSNITQTLNKTCQIEYSKAFPQAISIEDTYISDSECLVKVYEPYMKDVIQEQLYLLNKDVTGLNIQKLSIQTQRYAE